MYIFGFCKKHDCKLYRMNGMPDHIHMLVSLHPTIAVASFVHDLKIACSNFMKARKHNYPLFEGWERSYCALTYSDNDKDKVTKYIINQKEHHKGVSSKEELRKLLDEMDIEYDEKYI